ncbi:MAG: MerR family transcriptional regulator [bacterium]
MTDHVDVYEPILTIGTVAKMLGVAVQTIRLYEQEGLVLPFRTESGRRMYSMHEVERLHCVRKMITEVGMNLQGIRRMLSLLPCWEFKGGLDQECRHCPAYYEAEGPCWSMRGVGQKCQIEDCRACAVYRMQLNCKKIKQVIFGHQRPEGLESK